MKPQALGPDLAYVTTVFVNAYLVGPPHGPWVLVDTGLPGFAEAIRAAARTRFGPARARPEAIYLTHGHFDHAGNARELAEGWGVPVYAAPAETPFLNGRADFAPGDPTTGGFIGFMSRFFPHSGFDLRPFLRPLPDDPAAPLPGLPGWRWVPTPGHSPGHVSFFRDADRALLAGDAFATVDLQSWVDGGLTWRPRVSRPPLPFTPDWESAEDSVEALLALGPDLLACGHGRPMSGPAARAGLEALAGRFHPPTHGRYAHRPARPAGPDNFIPLPPAPRDPLPATLALVGAGLAVGASVFFASRLGRHRGKLRRFVRLFD